FQAEDGIRYFHVTGVQTCALPIFDHDVDPVEGRDDGPGKGPVAEVEVVAQAGAATRLHGDAQAQPFLTLLLEQALRLGRGRVSQDDTLLRGLAALNRHVLTPASAPAAHRGRPPGLRRPTRRYQRAPIPTHSSGGPARVGPQGSPAGRI